MGETFYDGEMVLVTDEDGDARPFARRTVRDAMDRLDTFLRTGRAPGVTRNADWEALRLTDPKRATDQGDAHHGEVGFDLVHALNAIRGIVPHGLAYELLQIPIEARVVHETRLGVPVPIDGPLDDLLRLFPGEHRASLRLAPCSGHAVTRRTVTRRRRSQP